MSLKTVYEQLDSAVLALVSSDDSIQARLDQAIAALSPLSEKELPPDCRKEFRQVQQDIRTYRAEGSRSEIQTALAKAIYGLLKSFIEKTSGFNGPGVMPM